MIQKLTLLQLVYIATQMQQAPAHARLSVSGYTEEWGFISISLSELSMKVCLICAKPFLELMVTDHGLQHEEYIRLYFIHSHTFSIT